MCYRLIVVAVMFVGLPISAAGQEVTERPPSKVFTALAATYAGLNALDVITTERAIQSGRGQEANPLMAPLVRNPYAFALTKAVTTASTIVVVRRIARKHPVAAVVFWVAADVGLGLVVAHNARVGAP
jgi:hypothetical protein